MSYFYKYCYHWESYLLQVPEVYIVLALLTQNYLHPFAKLAKHASYLFKCGCA